MNRRLRKILICNDVWMDILRFFDRAHLCLKLALLSSRFGALVDKHFDGSKTTELTLWNDIRICKENIGGPKVKLSVQIGPNFVKFSMPDRPLSNKISFKSLHIAFIDHSVLAFLRSNKQIWRRGTKLDLHVGYYDKKDSRQIWDVFGREIWPIFATINLRTLSFSNGDHLANLLRCTSPTMLTDLDQLNSIQSGHLCPAGVIAGSADFDGPTNAISGRHVLAKWLHTPLKDGQPKRLSCCEFGESKKFKWVNNFKEVFVRARTSVSYTVNFHLHVSTPIVPFEVVNERTKEKLTLKKKSDTGSLSWWIMQRCPIIGEKKDANSDANSNNSDANLSNSGANLSNSGANLNNSDANLNNSRANLNNSDAKVNNSRANLNNSDANSNNSDANLNNSDANLTNSRANLDNSDANLDNSDANLNNVFFYLSGFKDSIGPLSPSNEKVFSSDAGPSNS
ncbi:hypothetical protein niasHS_002006 [Heterodera schachtii]|uniref:Uncharacterized protein n=1 Tax=Heterodera schachtii TaxID=97005 RepID=A0ABD2K609_HETSC